MAKMIITDTPGLDGEYEADFDIGELTNRELRTIKKISGVTAGKLGEALKDGDNDLLIAYAVVFLVRAGKDPDMAESLLWDAPVGSLQFDMTDDEEEQGQAEADARPPDSPSGSGSVKEHDELESKSDSSESSGESSPTPSGSQEDGPSLIGLPRSGTGAA
jgi:hypothetical protein